MEKHPWLVVWTPLKNISQLGWLFPIYGKIKNGNQTTNQIHVNPCFYPVVLENSRLDLLDEYLDGSWVQLSSCTATCFTTGSMGPGSMVLWNLWNTRIIEIIKADVFPEFSLCQFCWSFSNCTELWTVRSAGHEREPNFPAVKTGDCEATLLLNAHCKMSLIKLPRRFKTF